MRWLALATVVSFVAASSGCAIQQKMPRPLTPEAVVQTEGVLESRGAWIEYGQPGQPSLIGAVQRGNFQKVGGLPPTLVLLTDEPKHAVPLEHVRSIQVNNHWLGAAEGLGAGVLTGALVGLLLTRGESHCDPADDNCLGMDFSGVILAASMVLGAAIGLAIGASVGQRYLYTF